jgi:hypothetical protein
MDRFERQAVAVGAQYCAGVGRDTGEKWVRGPINPGTAK